MKNPKRINSNDGPSIDDAKPGSFDLLIKPNWKDPNDYPTEEEAKAASLDLWAFQFLRRNADFVAEYEEARKQPHPRKTSEGDPIGWSQSPVGVVLKKWGIDSPMPPEWINAGVSDSPLVFDKYPVYAWSAGNDGNRIKLLPARDGLVVFGFNLSDPIGPQIKRAKAMLLLNQKSFEGPKRTGSRPRVLLFPNYLRVLDALAENVTSYKMVDVFAEEIDDVGEDTIRNWIKAAKALRDGGYRNLAPSPKP